MKKIYQSPEAEVISFAALEQLANLKEEVSLEFGNGNFVIGLSDVSKF